MVHTTIRKQSHIRADKGFMTRNCFTKYAHVLAIIRVDNKGDRMDFLQQCSITWG